MTTRGEINSNFYQIVNVDSNGAPTSIKPEYIPVGPAAGANTQIQFNDNDSLAGSSNLTFNKTTNTLSVTNSIVTNKINFTTASNVSLGNVSNLHITGGTSGYVLTTDGTGNLAWQVGGGGGGGSPGGINTYVQFNNAGAFGGVGQFTFNTSSNTLFATNYSGNAAGLSSITGANVVGFVGGADYATESGYTFSVEGANVVGYVANASHATIADSANSVSGSNVSGQVNFAAVANSVAGANVSGAVAYATTANSVAGANVSGDVAGANHANIADVANSVSVSNVSGIGNIATINLDGNISNLLHGNGYWGPETTSGNANYANYAGNVVIATQGNITSTGILTGVSVSGTANIANLSTTKYNENVQAGGSVSGTITPNVALGTIFNYTITGNITLNSLGNAVAGSGATLILTQGGSGSYTLTSSMKYAGGTKTLSTSVGAIDIVSVFYDGTTYYATLAKGFA